MALRVNIIGKSNGVGLDRDVRLLTAALEAAQCQVTWTRTGSRQSGRRKSPLFKFLWSLRRRLLPAQVPQFDINVMLEHVWTEYLPVAHTNVLVPNPDFFDRHDVAAVVQVDRVWAKTQQAVQLFNEMGAQVTHIGFDSEDQLLPNVVRQPTCFHLAGSSLLKGTQRLLSLWAAHPEWPMLIVAGRLKFELPSATNIRIYGGYLEDAFLKQLQNQSMIHVCTSEAEGWGHYLVEAMSVGAAVITVDAPPMNELVQPDRGWLLPCHPNGMHRLVSRFAFDEQALVSLMGELLGAFAGQVESKRMAARQWYERNQAAFPKRVCEALQELGMQPGSRGDSCVN